MLNTCLFYIYWTYTILDILFFQCEGHIPDLSTELNEYSSVFQSNPFVLQLQHMVDNKQAIDLVHFSVVRKQKKTNAVLLSAGTTNVQGN